MPLPHRAVTQALTHVQERPRALDRFKREARGLTQLDHPNIIAVRAVQWREGVPYLVTDLVEGTSMQCLLEAAGPLEPRSAATLVLSLCAAMVHAHSRGVLHRDLKPTSIIITPEGRALVADFGLALDPSVATRLTDTDQLVGSPPYMAPEQIGGRDVDERTDVYGLGATLYAALTGRPPFLCSNLGGLLDSIHDEPPIPIQDLRPEVDPDLEAVCLQALDKDPDRRYPSAAALGEDLQRHLVGLPVRARGRAQQAGGWLRRAVWVF